MPPGAMPQATARNPHHTLPHRFRVQAPKPYSCTCTTLGCAYAAYNTDAVAHGIMPSTHSELDPRPQTHTDLTAYVNADDTTLPPCSLAPHSLTSVTHNHPGDSVDTVRTHAWRLGKDPRDPVTPRSLVTLPSRSTHATPYAHAGTALLAACSRRRPPVQHIEIGTVPGAFGCL